MLAVAERRPHSSSSNSTSISQATDKSGPRDAPGQPTGDASPGVRGHPSATYLEASTPHLFLPPVFPATHSDFKAPPAPWASGRRYVQGMMATRFAKTNAPTVTRITDRMGTVGSGTT